MEFREKGEYTFIESFKALGVSDWILFSATDDNYDQLKVSRISERKFNISNTTSKVRKTIFMSDVYFFIAPEGYLDNQSQMKELVKLSEKTGAANDHKLLSIESLSDWIEELENAGQEKDVFTDDLLYINVELKPMLEKFAEFVKYVFK